MNIKKLRGLAVAVLGFAAFAMPARAANEQTILAIPAVNLLFLVQYVAADLHLWEKQGLDVKVINIVGIGSMNAVIAGSADFSMSSGATIARAAARGQKLVALATAITQSGQSIVVRKDVADAAHFDPKAPLSVRGAILKGRTWAHGGTGSIPDVILKVVGKDAGVGPDDMVATPMQPPEFLAAFHNHQIDGFSNSPPFVEQILLEGTGVLVSDTRIGEPTEFAPVSAALLLARGDFCAKSKTVCEKMVHGVVDALKVIKDNREQALGIMKAHFGTFDDKTLAAAYETVKAMTPVPPTTTAKMIENGDSLNVAAGFLKVEEKLPRYDDLIDNSFAEAAMK